MEGNCVIRKRRPFTKSTRHLPVDAGLDWRGRLHRSLELVNKAHNDVAQEEDNAFAQGLQQRALEHIDKAHHHIEEAIHIVE
jgi:hypothetical protein